VSEIKEDGHTDTITVLGFIPADPKLGIKETLYSASWDGSLRLWDWASMLVESPSVLGALLSSVGKIQSVSFNHAHHIFGVSGETGSQLVRPRAVNPPPLTNLHTNHCSCSPD